MNPCSEDIKDMLVADSALGITFWDGSTGNLFIGKSPMEPNIAIVLYDLPDAGPMLTLQQELYEYKTVQVRVRHTDYKTGYALAHDILESLHGQAQETWSGTLYSLIYCSSGPSFLEWDDNNRVIFMLNLEIQRR